MDKNLQVMKTHLAGSKDVEKIELEISLLTKNRLLAVREEVQRLAEEQYAGNRYLSAKSLLESIKNKKII